MKGKKNNKKNNNTTIKSTKKKTIKKASKKRRIAFTLIELLAVIVILGLLMLIAIPSVTSYINETRKSAYVDTAKQYLRGATNLVNSGKLDVFDPGMTYYIPSTCIELETGGESPYGGEFSPAYILVTYDNDSFSYYWMSRDNQSMGVKNPTLSDNLTNKSVEAGVSSEDIKTDIGIDGRDQYLIFNSTCSEKESEGYVSVHTDGNGEILPEQQHDEGYLNLSTRRYFNTLEEAVDDASSNQTIRVLKDTTEDTTTSIPSNISGLIIDFNGHMVSYDYRLDYSMVNNGSIVLTDSTGQSGNLDIFNEIVNHGTVEVSGSLYLRSENMIFNNDGVVNIKGGELVAYDSLAIENRGTINFSGGQMDGYSFGVYNYGTLNVSGGLISGDTAIQNEEGATTNITGSDTTIKGNQIGIKNFGTLNYTDAKIRAAYPYSERGIVNYGTSTLNNVDIEAITSGRSYTAYGIQNEYGQMTITGGRIISKTTAGSGAIGIYNNANLTINNVTIDALTNNSNGMYATGIKLNGTSNTTIKSGTITGAEYGIETNGNVTLTLGTNDANVTKTTPVIEGVSNNGVGLKIGSASGSTFNFYDGILRSRRGINYTIQGTAANENLPTGYVVYSEQAESAYVSYLRLPR